MGSLLSPPGSQGPGSLVALPGGSGEFSRAVHLPAAAPLGFSFSANAAAHCVPAVRSQHTTRVARPGHPGEHGAEWASPTHSGAPWGGVQGPEWDAPPRSLHPDSKCSLASSPGVGRTSLLHQEVKARCEYFMGDTINNAPYAERQGEYFIH